MRYFGPRHRSWLIDFGELWAFRDVLIALAVRDFRVQYRQAIVGVAWAVIRPLMLMIVFTALFRLLGRIPATATETYAISLYAGLLPWQLFATTLSKSSLSLVANQTLLTKVYFPRLILPMVPLAVGLIDFAIAALVLFVMMGWQGIVPHAGVLMLPVFVVLAVLASFAVATWLSAANALYRDIGHALPFVIQLGMFISPVVYEMEALIPERWQPVYALNPMVGVLEGFRWSLLGGVGFPTQPVALSLAVTTVILLGGLLYFRHVERVVTDRV